MQQNQQNTGLVSKQKTKRNNWVDTALCLGLGLLCLAGTVMLFGIRYELNDDAIISNIAAGAYGTGTQYLVYVNVLLGWLLKPFYLLPGSLNWFVLLLLAGGVVCFTLLGRLLVQKLGRLAGLSLFVAFLALVGVDFFQRFHYVKYAGLFLTVGLVLVLQNLGHYNKGLAAGLVLALLGSMLRFQQFFAIGGLAAALLLYKFFTLDKPKKIKAAVGVGLLVVLAFGAKGIDTMAYNTHEGWATYARYNALRTEISDFKLQFATGPEVLQPLGYTATDFEMLQTWNFYDGDVFSASALQEVIAALPGNTPGRALRQALTMGSSMLYARPAGFLFGAVLLGWLFLSNKKWWPALLGTLAILAAEILYLCWQGRLPPTIHFSLTMAAFIFCTCCIKLPQAPQKNWFSFVAAVLVLCSIPSFIGFKDAADTYWESRPPREAEFISFTQNKDTLYLADVDLVDAANGYNVWTAKPKGYFENIVFTGSWLAQSPFQQQALQSHGLNNLYRDSIDKEDVIYLDFVYRALKEDYLRQHYAAGASLQRIEEGVTLHAYAARTGVPAA
ncbi:hypothetical protein LJC61_07150 [Ruminococcaceae bacterium OttesenSCG-928-A16]|nr:hypothetical protein [Ruminococcaceae bacterium OttesenSCG-928-A16]